MPAQNQVRIIGGKWRSRKLHFPDLLGLRPTPDRVRETLFNWLTPYIIGARCLDLFAGSGALSFEALSRGAASAVMVDQSPLVIQQLQANAKLLHTEAVAQFHCSKIPNDKLPITGAPFDIIFLDPPFHQNYLPLCCQWLEKAPYFTQGTLIYIEVESSLVPALPIPSNWTILRQQKAGQVGYCLATVTL